VPSIDSGLKAVMTVKLAYLGNHATRLSGGCQLVGSGEMRVVSPVRSWTTFFVVAAHLMVWCIVRRILE
jgi:hypothetical protein